MPAHKLLSSECMPLLTAPTKARSKTNRSKAVPSPSSLPIYAAEEINAYIAIRDQLLSEAEKTPSGSKFDSVIIANDFVAGCLKPARSPYEVQCLPEATAQQERKRCAAVSDRVAVLRAGAA